MGGAAAVGGGGADAGAGGAVSGGVSTSGGGAAAQAGQGSETPRGGQAGQAGRGGDGVGPVIIEGPPFTTRSGLFDQSKADLGLAKASGTETVTIFSAQSGTDHYANGVVLTAFQGSLYAMWQSSPTDEDSTDTWTAYSRSQDGKTWSAPSPLAAPSTDQRASGGWWVNGDTLVAYINVFPSGTTPRSGYTEFRTSKDGVSWTAAQRLKMKDGSNFAGIIEQDPHALPSGRVIGAGHFSPGLMVAPTYTDDASGVAGWVRAPFTSLSASETMTRELEPSWFLRKDGGVVMVFRDQSSTYKKLASLSPDRGESWLEVVETDMPDSRSKQSAGNLPSGAAFLVGNPVAINQRYPLVVTLSRDGFVFDKAFLLRTSAELPARRYDGKAKTLGYNYPKSIVYDGYLYAGYATNKEDVELTRVPLESLSY